MDRKVKHYDKPGHQRWLYRLSDFGLVKAILIIWGICFVIIVVTLILVKFILTFTNKLL
jgi:hypothetical protein